MSWKVTIFLNIIGGIFAGLAVLGIEYLYKFFRARSFRRFFGMDDEYNIIYCLYDAPVCPRSDPDCKIVFRKPERPTTGAKAVSGINLQRVTSVAGAKGVAYIVEAFSRNLRKAPMIAADVDPHITTRMDISFVSVGGRTNYKTCDLLEDLSNNFLDFNGSAIITKKSSEKIAVLENAGQGNDFGFIVKIHPNNNRERTWICCCGFGIVGTIGAAYYLANKWKEIRKYVGYLPLICYGGYQPFGLVVRSQAGSEDSGIPVHLVISSTNRFLDWFRGWKAKKNGLKVTFVEASGDRG